MHPDILLAASAPYTTPLAIVDETVMCASITAMQTLADKVGAALRPHAKTQMNFGIVVDHPDVILERLIEEHGVLVSKADTGLHIGDRVIIIPIHCCTTVNLHEQVLMVSAEGTAAWNETGARGWQPL